jgi:nucleotide-binding universal stress UspA family protein
VIPASGSGLTIELDLEERQQSAKREASSRRIEELQSTAGSRALVSIAIGPIKDMLTDEARRLRADVLVIGRSPHFGVLGRSRDLSYALARDAPCPVLSV